MGDLCHRGACDAGLGFAMARLQKRKAARIRRGAVRLGCKKMGSTCVSGFQGDIREPVGHAPQVRSVAVAKLRH